MTDKELQIKEGSHDYDEEYRKGAHWDVERPSSNMPRFVELIKGSRDVLDAGCGGGRDSRFLASQGFVVTGVDSSSVGIDLAGQRSRGIPNLTFEVGTIEDLPFPDSSFDAAYSGYVLGGATLSKQASELSRVLRPGKTLYVAMFTRITYETPSERDEQNPLESILETFGEGFDIRDKALDTYTEEDDHGKHEHERLKLVLVNNK